MSRNWNNSRAGLWAALIIVLVAPVSSLAAAPHAAVCAKVVLNGEANAGQEWRQPFGQGWVFRVVPIQPGNAGYSGWDLVVDRDQPAGYPDALLVATPPYYSISQREVGTTFGLRAQDAIGWNPRSFHFLTDPDALHEGQKQFQALGGTRIWTERPQPGRQQSAEQRLLEINRRASAGQFRILNARLTPGIADAAPFAQRWAIQSMRTPHTIAPPTDAKTGGKTTQLGQLAWIKFSVTLWLPPTWKSPKELAGARGPCSE